MANQPVLSTALIEKLGFARNLLTLTATVEVRAHPDLLDDMAVLRVEEFDEPIYCDRDYLRRNQIRFGSQTAAGSQLLAWARPERRRRSDDPANPEIELVTVLDMFRLGHPPDFKRFQRFVDGLTLRDTQAREYLARKAEEFPLLVVDEEGVASALRCLSRIVDTAEVDLGLGGRGTARPSHQHLGKQYAEALSAARKSPLLVPLLVRLEPAERFNAFRLLCYAEDPESGTAGMIDFVRALAGATGYPALVERSETIDSAEALRALLEGLNAWLLSPRRPGAG